MTDYEMEAANMARLERLMEEIGFCNPLLSREEIQVEAERQMAAEIVSRQEAWGPMERTVVTVKMETRG